MMAHPCKQLSVWVHKLPAPAMSRQFIPEYPRDTFDFVRNIDDIRERGIPTNIDGNDTPFTVDVEAMCPSITWSKGADTAANM